MPEPHDPNETVDVSSTDPNETVPDSSTPADSLDAGLAAGFGRPANGPGSVLTELRTSLGPLRPVLLKEAEGESGLVVKPNSDAMPSKAEAGERYQLAGEIARGGMGAVLRGRDVDLGRELAVKVLLEKYADRPEVARRFIEEAQIGGQLQHPGVVPVYDIGRFGELPYFTMKLVKGQTLAAILGERTEATEDRPRLLGIALQVSQAMAYAHAKGVIHRDLKPANIMVGAFGEVQVMDWGLAKVLAEGGVADEERASRAHQTPEDVTTIRTARSTGSHGSLGTDTEAGSIMGTPAYMPPEQAVGDIANLDRRADVFALGAILCEFLTGKPPYVGRNGEEVRRKAANGDLADATARLDACGADHDLIALTKQCLAPEPIDRPRDAQGVADRLTDYLDGVQERLQTAERERAVADVRTGEERRRRKVQLALAGSVALLLLGAGSVAWWQNVQAGARRETDLRRQLVDEQRAAADTARLARNAEAVSSLLGQCEASLKDNDADQAALVLDAARKRSAEGGAENQAERLGRLGADLALLRDLDAVDQFRWTFVENKIPDPAAVASQTREALARFGADPDAVPVDDAAARVGASVVRERIISALDRVLWREKSDEVSALLQRVDANSYRNTVRDAVLANDESKLRELAAQADALEQPPGFAAFLGEILEFPPTRRQAILETAVRQRPGDLSLLMTLRRHISNVDERLRWEQAALAVAPNNSVVLGSLGNSLFQKGKHDEAIACYRKSIEIDPENSSAHSNMGIALYEKGLVNEAIACFQKAIEVNPKSVYYFNLGSLLNDIGQFDEAIAFHRKAIELNPTNPGPHSNLAFSLMEIGDLTGAMSAIEKALPLNPIDASPRFTLAKILLVRSRFAEAVPELEWTIRLMRSTDPTIAEEYKSLLPKARWLADQAETLKSLAAADGGDAPEPTALDLAARAREQDLPALAARLAELALTASPRRANDLKAGYRHAAARAAALAGTGSGHDDPAPDDAAKAELRRLALDYLRADLDLYVNQLPVADPAARTQIKQSLEDWRQAPDLASIRDEAALAKLPEGERKEFQALWSEVDAILAKTMK